MNEFDYLNDSLVDWAYESQVSGLPLNEREVELLAVIEQEYLPRFEQAIWRKAAGK